MSEHSWNAWVTLYPNCSELRNHSKRSKEEKIILQAEEMFCEFQHPFLVFFEKALETWKLNFTYFIRGKKIFAQKAKASTEKVSYNQHSYEMWEPDKDI